MKAICFEEILNGDPEFSRENYLLNYGVAGYGVDQIYLLFEQSLELYRRPLVVVSLLRTDLDRTILSDQKPHFEPHEGKLVLPSGWLSGVARRPKAHGLSTGSWARR